MSQTCQKNCGIVMSERAPQSFGGRTAILVVPPFASIARPDLATSLLKSILVQHGVPCRIIYSNIHFAEAFGPQVYQIIAEKLSPHLLVGEWIFRESAFSADRGEVAAREFIEFLTTQLAQDGWVMDPSFSDWFQQTREIANQFVQKEGALIASLDPLFVGFTSTFQQTVASVALARSVKRHLQVAVVVGGANCEGDMGEQLWRSVEHFDYVCSGEGEEAIVELAASIKAGTRIAIPGCFGPRGNYVAVPTRRTDINQNPEPNFDDYFATINSATFEVQPVLTMETSRGCWWGAKNQCTFCGLSSETIRWRHKRWDTSIKELRSLLTRYGRYPVLMTDLILPHSYYNDFLDELAKEPLTEIFYEIKANVSRDNVLKLARAGVRWVQPGIESLSNSVLRLMSKGVTAVQNVALLKWSLSAGITVTWNFLTGFPHECDEWYAKLVRDLPNLMHLQPPTSAGSVRLDRYSPLYNEPKLGAVNTGPAIAYRHVYPWSIPELERIAYYFEMDLPGNESLFENRDKVLELVNQWQACWKNGQRPTLFGTLVDGAVTIRDTRGLGGDTFVELSPAESWLIIRAESPTSLKVLESEAGKIMGQQQVKTGMAGLEKRKLLFASDALAVSLVVFPVDDAPTSFQSTHPAGALRGGHFMPHPFHQVTNN